MTREGNGAEMGEETSRKGESNREKREGDLERNVERKIEIQYQFQHKNPSNLS